MDVIFFPRNDYPNNIEVCKHRLGKKMTYVDSTTMIPYWVSVKLLPWFSSLSATSGLKESSAFDNINNGDPNRPYSSYLGEYVMEQIATGVIWPDLYFMPNPSNDYSQESVDRGREILFPWFENKFGRKPSAVDHASSNFTYKQYIQDYLLAATYDPPFDSRSLNCDYGIGCGSPSNLPYAKSRYYPRTFNFRILDWARSDNENYSYYIGLASDMIDATLALPNGGLLTNFSHWHDLLYLDYDKYTGEPIEGRNDYAVNNGFKAYYNMLAQKNSNGEIYFAGYGESIEYLVYRDSISKCVMYSPIGSENNKLVIRLEVRNSYNVDTSLLQTPVSVKFSTVGTPLANQNIRCDYNIVNLGNNQYIVEIPYSEYAGAVIEKLTT